MSQQRGTYRTSCGKLQPMYVQARRTPSSLWVTQGSAKTADQLAGLIARSSARNAGAELRVVEFTGGARTERPVVEETTTAATARAA